MKKLNCYTSRTDYIVSKYWQLLWRSAIVAIVTLLLSQLNAFAQKSPPNPGVGGTVFGVEIDADFKSGEKPTFWNNWQSQYTNFSSTGADWSTAAGVLNKSGGVSVPGKSTDGRTLWQQDGNWGNKSAVAEVSTFAGTSNKNGQQIHSGGEPYTVQLGGSGPQKNDITDIFLHTREVTIGGTPHTILFFGAATRATSGASYLDFEYNQAGVTVADGFMTGKGTVGGRTVGDFVLVVNYEGGGSKPVVGYRVWQSSGTWTEEQMVSGTNNGYITTNIADILPVAPNQGFKGDGSFTNVTGAFQFVEGGIDITALDLTGASLCSPEATLTVKTRSSPSFTAELKDLSVADFPLVPGATLTDLSPQTKCPGESASFSTTVSGDGANGANVKWYKGSVSNANEITTGINSTSTTSTLTISSVVEGNEDTYIAKLFGSTCGEPMKSSTLTVNPIPAGSNTSMASCPTNIGGTTAVFDLTSKNSTVVGTSGASVEGWYEAYASGSFSSKIAAPDTYTSSTGNTVYAKLIGSTANGGCTGVASNALTVNPTPAGVNTSMASCPTTGGGTTAVFDLTSKNSTVVGTSGASVEGWYEAYASGIFSSKIADPTTYASATGNTVYAKLIGSSANGSCTGVASNALTVNPSAAGPQVTYNAPACDEAVFSVTVDNPELNVEYTIVDKDGGNSASITITTAGEVKFTNRPAGSGYSVTAKVGDCISEASTCTPSNGITAIEATSTKSIQPIEKVTGTQLTAYPVPFYEMATVEFKAENTGDYVVNLYDLKGTLIRQLKAGTAKEGEMNSIEVNGSNLSEGMYLVRFVNGTGSKTIKILKKK